MPGSDRGGRGAVDRRSDRVLGAPRPGDRTLARGLPGPRPAARRRGRPALRVPGLGRFGSGAPARRGIPGIAAVSPVSAGSRLAGAGGSCRCRWHPNPGAIRRPGIPGGPMPLMEFAEFDRRPILVANAGPNGAGKTAFFHAHLASAGLRFVNADVLAAELAVEPYEAARLADALRQALVGRRESFVF